MMLAQADSVEQVNQGLLRVFDYIKSLSFPSRAEFVTDLETLGQLQAVALVLAGVLFLVYGFKYFKALVIINAAAIGALVGMYLGAMIASPNMPLLLGLAGAILLGALAWPTIKYFVCLMGALAGGLLGFALWHVAASAVSSEVMLRYAWAGGLIGTVAVGLLAFLVARFAIMVFTAVQGSVMFVSGGCAVLLAFGGIHESVRSALADNDHVLKLLFAVPAVLGFTYQYSVDLAKVKKKRAATEKPPV
jgi:hypothetical protein